MVAPTVDWSAGMMDKRSAGLMAALRVVAMAVRLVVSLAGL